MEDKKPKKTSWTYTLGNHILEANFPDGSSATFDLTRCVKDMTQTQELGFQYGIKQWMSSNYASCETVEERIESAKADYKGLIEHGLELSEGGKTMGIVGKVRSNAAAGIKMELKEAKNLNVLLMKKVAGKPLTEEEEKWLAEMTEKYA
jgi:hypothetical protein